jgi:hypothetical protein
VSTRLSTELQQAIVHRIANVVEQAGRLLLVVNSGDIEPSVDDATDALTYLAEADHAIFLACQLLDPLAVER